MSLAIPMDQPPEPDDAPAEACRSCDGEGILATHPAIVCDHCDGTGDEPAELPCAS